MQHIYQATLLIFVCIFFSLHDSFSQCTCTIIFDGTQSNINLNNGDVFCIPKDFTYSSGINNFPSGSTICVEEGGTFIPTSLNNPGGTLENSGMVTLPGIAANAGFEINNAGTIDFASNVNLNGRVTMTNTTAGILNFQQSFTLANGSSMTNNGEVSFTADFNTNVGTTFDNYGNLYTNQFNPGGVIRNYGLVDAEGFININSNSSVTNYCSFISEVGFNNNSGNTVNLGIIVISAGTFQNNAPFYSGTDGEIVGTNFINSSTITGGGSFYFSGSTNNSGASFGADDFGINFYDASLDAGIMDFNTGTIGAAVTNNAFTPVDKEFISGGCNFKSEEICGNGIDDDRDGAIDSDDPDCVIGAQLPVELSYFEVDKVAAGVQLNWETATEKNNAYFLVERSANGQTWDTIDKIPGQGTTTAPSFYSLLDSAPLSGANYYRLKQVDFDGQFEYSNIRFIEGTKTQTIALSLYPQPARDWLQIEGNTSLEEVQISVYDSFGQIQKLAFEQNGTIRLNTSTLKPGMYLLLLDWGAQQTTQTFFIQ